MKYVYVIYSPILTISFLLFFQRGCYWAKRWIRGKKILSRIGICSDKYISIYEKLWNARIQCVCWYIISLVNLYACIDCMLNIIARW